MTVQGGQADGDPPMSRKERLRRVVILCTLFTRNLAYYQVGSAPEYQHLYDRNCSANFWITASNNSIDVCVQEWYKLFADKNGKHHWRQIVTDPAAFEAALLSHLGLDETEFQKEIDALLRYRDKFLAHLDSDRKMNIPRMDIAKKAVWFYHAHIVKQEAQPGDLEFPSQLATELDSGYAQSKAEITTVLKAASSRP